MKKSSSWKYLLWTAASVSMTSSYATAYTAETSTSNTTAINLNVNTTIFDQLTFDGLQAGYTVTPGSGGVGLDAMTSSDSIAISGPSNPITINIVDNSTDATISAPITLTGSAATLSLQPTTGNTITLSGALTSGDSTIEVNGAGSVALSGTNTAYTSLIKVLSGDLKVNSTIGADFDVRSASNGMLVSSDLSNTGSIIYNGDSVTFNAASGTNTIAAIIQNGTENGEVGTVTINSGNQTGTVNFTGNNTYTGLTTITAGTAKISSSGPLLGNIAVAGTLDLSNSADAVYSQEISGAGHLVSSSVNRITLNGTPTFTGDITSAGIDGVLQLGPTWVGAKPGLNVSYSQDSTVEMNVSTTQGANAGSPLVYSGNFAQTNGTGNFTKLGAGWLELSGTHAESGVVTVSEGGLIVNTVSLPAAGSSFEIASEKDLYIKTDNGTPASYSGNITGPGALTVMNGGSLELTGNYDVAGLTTITGANTALTVAHTANASALPNDVSVAASTNSITFNVTDNVDYSGVVSGLGSIIKTGGSTLTLTGANTNSGGTTITGGTLEVQRYMNGNYVNNANMIITLSASDNPTTYSGVISGSGNVSKQGLNHITLNAVQSYTGDTTINGGTIYYGIANALASTTDVLINNTDYGTLSLVDSAGTTAYNATVQSLSGAGTLALGSTVAPPTLTVGDATDKTFSGAITGNGNITKVGAGNWTVSHNNSTNIANTDIQNGTLTLGHASALGASVITITGGAKLDANAFTVGNTIDGITGEIKNSGNATAIISSALPLTGTTTLNASTESLTMSALISGSSALSLTGAAGKTVTTNGEVRVDENITATTADISHNNKLVAFNGRIYNVASGNVNFTSNATLSLAGGTFKVNTGAISLTGSTVMPDAGRHAGASTVVSTDDTGKLTIAASNTVNMAVPFAKTVEYALNVDGTGNIAKNNLGTVKYSGATTHTGTTTVNGGRLIYTGPAAASSTSAVTLARYSDFEILDNAGSTVSRNITGSGHFTKSGSATLILNGAINYTGNTYVSAGNLTFGSSGSVAVGSQAVIRVADGLTLQYSGAVNPLGVSFNPILGTGSSLIMDGATIGTSSVTGNNLSIGNSAYTMTIGAGGLDIDTSKPTVLYSTLAGTGPLEKLGTSTLILNDIGANTGYSGAITVTAGILGLNDNYDNNSDISVGTTGTLIMDYATSKASTKAITGVAGSTFIKKGSGTVIFDGAGKIDAFEGDLYVDKGRMQLRNSGLHANSAITVKAQASLDVLSRGASATAVTLPDVTLKTRGALRIINEDLIGSSANIHQTSVTQLTAENGAVLVLQVVPGAGSATTPAISGAPLKLGTLTTTGSNSSKLFVQVRPTTTTVMTEGQIYPLIEPNGGSTVAEIVSRIRLMPSIMFNASYVLGGATGSTPTARYGNLVYTPGTGIYLKVGTSQTGFYAGSISSTDPSAAVPPANAYYQTFMSQILGHGHIEAYSALDQFLTAHHLRGTSDWAMISPLAQVGMNQAFLNPDLALTMHTQEVFGGQERQSHMQSLMQNQSLKGEARKALQGQSMLHQNLQTQSQVKQSGHWKGWSNAFALSGMSVDNNYTYESEGKMTGVSMELSSQQALGYQFSDVEQNYQAINGDRSGSIRSQISQAHSYTMLGNARLATNITVAKHDCEHSRIVDVEMDEGYFNSWTAKGQHNAHEARIEQTAMMDQSLNSMMNISAGARYQAAVVAHDGYVENNAENLNLHVQGYTTQQHMIQPMVGMSYHQGHGNSWIYMQATAGYQYHAQSSTEVSFGFDAYRDATMRLPIEQPAHNAYTLGFEAMLGSTSGFSVSTHSQMAYHAELGSCEYQGNVSATWAF